MCLCLCLLLPFCVWLCLPVCVFACMCVCVCVCLCVCVCRYSDARSWRAYMGMRVMNTGSNAAVTRLIRRIFLHTQYDQLDRKSVV